jgi:hypothetical protein
MKKENFKLDLLVSLAHCLLSIKEQNEDYKSLILKKKKKAEVGTTGSCQ